PITMLTDDAPAYERPYAEPEDLDTRQDLSLDRIALPEDYNRTLLQLLDAPNIASKAWIYRQYDSLVRSNTVVGPGSDAAILRIKGSKKGIAVTVDCNSRYCLLDPYVGATIAVAEAARNISCAGAVPIGLTDCMNFGNPEKSEVMWQFAEAVHGIRDACLSLEIPVVGGNVSFYNETDGRPIPPTPTIGMVGLIEDITRHMTIGFKTEGDVVALLGRSREELGGTEYLALRDIVAGTPPWIDLSRERNVQNVCRTAIEEGLLESAHDVSEGGLAVALAECCINAPSVALGASVQVDGAIRPDAALFGESQSRIVVSLRRRNLSRLRELANDADVPMSVLGEVRGKRLQIDSYIDIDVEELKRAWCDALPTRMG
ncbi:MAG TPA: AIR synthase related protein, partial [Terriglobales bacterium]|nr:AIR synthase related protein [Terriglobales bacterium]